MMGPEDSRFPNLPPLPDSSTDESRIKIMYQAYESAVMDLDRVPRGLANRTHAIARYSEYLDGHELREAVELKELEMKKVATPQQLTRLEEITYAIALALFPDNETLRGIKFNLLMDRIPPREDINLLNAHCRFPDDSVLQALELKRLSGTISADEIKEMESRITSQN